MDWYQLLNALYLYVVACDCHMPVWIGISIGIIIGKIFHSVPPIKSTWEKLILFHL